MLPNRLKVYSSRSIDHKMNTYLLCTFLFILSMTSSHALSWYRNDQKSTEETINNIPSDELDLVFGNTDANVNAEKAKETLEKEKIEALVHQNFTYLVAFVSKVNSEVLCQGALIDPLWVLTSATCLKKYTVAIEVISVVTGFHLPNITVREIKNVYFHPDFQVLTNLNDIALVEVDEEIKNDTLTPIALTKSRDPTTARCDFSAIYNNTMIAFRVDLVSPHDCIRKELPKQNLYYYCAGVNGRQIVLTQDDMLGVPLVCNGQLFGIKSLSTMFTSVPDVYDWIVKRMKHQPYITVDNVPRYTSVMNISDPTLQSEPQKSEPEKNKEINPLYTGNYATESPDPDNTTKLIYSI